VSFFAARKGERRDCWAAFLTLLSLIASHALLETARDALFLARIPAARLPWVFLAIAALSIGTLKLHGLVTRGRSPRRALTSATLFAAAVTLGFFWLERRLGAFGLYALYVWSGLLATFLLVQFWDLVGTRFTITQAKRLYGFIGAGGVIGAIVGSGAASLLSRVVGPERLVLCSAFGFAVAGLIPLLFSENASAVRAVDEPAGLRDNLGVVARDPYARRLIAALFVATVCLTLSDFVFKSMIAELVPKAELGAVLGAVYFGANVLSLFAQLWLVGWVLKRVSLGAALGVLPALLALGGLGVAVSGGLAAVVALKTADGSLRYSLHRTTAELLCLPFGDEGRQRVKTMIDLVAQRGGQVLASLAILGLGALHAQPRVLALGLAVFALAWLVSAAALRAPYIALFRARLHSSRAHHLSEFPELDVSSLETLLRALESDNDREVLAALSVLERENKTALVPALLLHHPSEAVVLRVLAILSASGRKTAVRTISRIADHASARVRAAALAARSVLEPDAQQLRLVLEQESSVEVRATLIVNLIVSGAYEGAERERHIEGLLRDGSVATRLAFAEAIGRRSAHEFDHVLARLLSAPELEVRRAALVAASSVASPLLMPLLVRGLGDEATRSEAEQALAARGSAAFDALRQSFEDTSTKPSLRWRIPAAMALCSAERTLHTLLAWLPKEPDGGVRFGILIILERVVRQNPTLSVDKPTLAWSVSETLTRAYRFLDARLQLVRGALEDAARKTPGHELLRDLLRDKEESARQRLFRLLALLHPSEDLGQIYRSLSIGKEQRTTSVELIESILREPVRNSVLGLVDDCADELRLARAGQYHRPKARGYAALLEHLQQSESEAVREVAEFHAVELGLGSALAEPAGGA
jgi:ATP:ADP antiporter, AAA family